MECRVRVSYLINVVCFVGVGDRNQTATGNQIDSARLSENLVAHVEVKLHVAFGK